MTNEEVIDRLDTLKDCEGVEVLIKDKDVEAFNFAIEAIRTKDIYLQNGDIYIQSKDYNMYIEGYKVGMINYKEILQENQELKEEIKRYKKALSALHEILEQEDN